MKHTHIAGYLSFLILLVLGTTLLLTGCGEKPEPFHSSDFVSTAPEEDRPPADNRPVLRIAVAAMISPETTRTYYEDLIRLIGDGVGRRVVFAQRRTYAEVNTMLEEREVEVAFVCSGPYTKGHEDFGLELLVVPIAHGEKSYYSCIITRTNEHAQEFQDLRNMRFVFTDPDSNTGYLVPKYMLAQFGETPRSFFSDTFFSGSHDASIKAVVNGLACGAAVDSLVWEFMHVSDPELVEKTKIIEKSPSYGMPPIVVHPKLNAKLKKQLRDVFLNLHKDKEAAALMARVKIDRFETTEDEKYNSIREMRCWLKEREKTDLKMRGETYQQNPL